MWHEATDQVVMTTRYRDGKEAAELESLRFDVLGDVAIRRSAVEAAVEEMQAFEEIVAELFPSAEPPTITASFLAPGIRMRAPRRLGTRLLDWVFGRPKPPMLWVPAW